MTVRPYREDPSIRIRDESLASLGSNFVSLGYSKTNARCLSFKVLFYPLNIWNVSTFYKHGASGFSSDTIVINNVNRKWQIIDTNG